MSLTESNNFIDPQSALEVIVDIRRALNPTYRQYESLKTKVKLRHVKKAEPIVKSLKHNFDLMQSYEAVARSYVDYFNLGSRSVKDFSKYAPTEAQFNMRVSDLIQWAESCEKTINSKIKELERFFDEQSISF